MFEDLPLVGRFVGRVNEKRARRQALRRRDLDAVAYAEKFADANALELGGPSAVFAEEGTLPLYPRLRGLDILDFADETLWTSSQSRLSVPRGKRLVGEASDLSAIESGTYDAVLASHILEHLANPLAALEEWRRVLRPGGRLVLVVPHREGTFDHRRPVTTLAHLQKDAAEGTDEADLTHLGEVLRLHDLARDPGADPATFRERCEQNATVRAMHHHVFDMTLVAETVEAVGLSPDLLRAVLPDSIVCVAGSSDAENGRRALADGLARSPFSSDRTASR